MDPLYLYLAIMNVAAFIATALILKRRQTATLACAFAVAGGSVGTLLALCVWDRHVNKSNVAAWFASLAGVAGWSMALAIISGRIAPSIDAVLQTDWPRLAPFALIYAALNLATFMLFGIDKRLAVKSRRRIPEAALLAFAFVGGAGGAMIAMRTFRHKTSVWYFAAGLPVMFALQLAALTLYLSAGAPLPDAQSMPFYLASS